MTEAVTDIGSDTLLGDVEHHFRVQAGPGAGKTHWLVEHIKNVLHKSTRLTPASRIACISYTNVAVNEIRERLGPGADRVDTSTIHSFLYRNVLKPYLHLVTDADGKSLVKFKLVDGHDKHSPSYRKVEQWIGQLNNAKLRAFLRANQASLFRELCKAAFQLNPEGGRWVIRDSSRFPSLTALSSQEIELYKGQYWSDGIIDHEDVLYFAYRILDDHPVIRAFLSARFPYIVVDEFQDTNPVQTQVVKWLAEGGSAVGVIGDPEQSIFGFQGAQRQDFVAFSLPDLRSYRIADNRRSTSPIVGFLNHVRTDGLTQVPLRRGNALAGEPVRVLVGDPAKAVEHARSCLPDASELHVLARKNNEVARLRTQTGSPSNDTWERFQESDYSRARFFEHLITGVEAARTRSFTVGLKELILGMRMRNGTVRKPLKCPNAVTELQCRGIVLSLLNDMLTRYQELSTSKLMSVYKRVDSTLGSSFPGLSLSGVNRGKFKEFAEATNYNDLAVTIRLADETRSVRTMHNAKAAEFDNVLVCMGEGKRSRLAHILDTQDRDPEKPDAEERRVTYVAISRARDRLFLSMPSLTDEAKRQLTKLGLKVEHVS